jgi:hypothetical protein
VKNLAEKSFLENVLVWYKSERLGRRDKALLVDPEPDLVRTPLLASVRKENESGFDVLYLDIYFVLPHKGAPAACQDNSTHC